MLDPWNHLLHQQRRPVPGGESRVSILLLTIRHPPSAIAHQYETLPGAKARQEMHAREDHLRRSGQRDQDRATSLSTAPAHGGRAGHTAGRR